MFRLHIPSRPIRYAVVATHAFRSALDDIDVDLTGVEQTLADQLEALTTKVDALQARLEAMDEATLDDKPVEKAGRKPKAASKAGKRDEVSAKAKSKATRSRSK